MSFIYSIGPYTYLKGKENFIEVSHNFNKENQRKNIHLEYIKYMADNKIINKLPLDIVIEQAIENGHLDLIKYIFNIDEFKDSELINYTFRLASRYGKIETLKFLCTLEGIDAGFCDNYAIKSACEYGHLEVVKFLSTLKEVDVSEANNYPFRIACKNGHLEVVKFLSTLDVVCDTGGGIWPAVNACTFGHLEVLKFLSSLSWIRKTINHQVFRAACANGRLEIVKFLFSLNCDLVSMKNYRRTIKHLKPSTEKDFIKSLSERGYTDLVKFLKLPEQERKEQALQFVKRLNAKNFLKRL